MSEETDAGAFAHVPTLSERIWRRLGFRYHLGDEPQDVDGLNGWMMSTVNFDFGLADRLRLLLTGRLRAKLVQHTTVQCAESKNRLDWQILAPGDR